MPMHKVVIIWRKWQLIIEFSSQLYIPGRQGLVWQNITLFWHQHAVSEPMNASHILRDKSCLCNIHLLVCAAGWSLCAKPQCVTKGSKAAVSSRPPHSSSIPTGSVCSHSHTCVSICGLQLMTGLSACACGAGVHLLHTMLTKSIESAPCYSIVIRL